jgi:hypothetical protein
VSPALPKRQERTVPKKLRKGRNTRDRRIYRETMDELAEVVRTITEMPDAQREQFNINAAIRYGLWDELSAGNTMPWRSA